MKKLVVCLMLFLVLAAPVGAVQWIHDCCEDGWQSCCIVMEWMDWFEEQAGW